MSEQRQGKTAYFIEGAVLVGVVLVYFQWSKIEPYVSQLTDIFGPNLEAVRDEVNVNGDGPPIFLPRVTITTKGKEAVKITAVRFNERASADCNVTGGETLLTGDGITVGVPFSCGKPVRVKIETDRGSSSFEW